MSDGIHGTLRVGTAGELTGRVVFTSDVTFHFVPDGLTDYTVYAKDEATFTPDPPTLPTRPLAVIETVGREKDGLPVVSAMLTRDGFWVARISSGGVVVGEDLMTIFADRPWHVVFEGVDEQ